jgi:hypothetical protein
MGAQAGRWTMAKRKRQWGNADAVERAEFVGRTVKEMCELLRADAGYPEVSERLERARGALETLRVALWQRELVRTVAGRPRAAA